MRQTFNDKKEYFLYKCSTFVSDNPHTLDLEVNEWLQNNKLEAPYFTRSQSGSGWDASHTITIFYKSVIELKDETIKCKDKI